MPEPVENTAAAEVNTPAPARQNDSRLDALSSFLSPSEIAEIEKEAIAQEPTAPAATTTPEQTPEGEGAESDESAEESAEDAPEQTPEQKAAEEAKATEAAAKAKETKSILGLKKPGEKKSDIVIEKPEEILGALNSKFGLALKEPKDLPKFIELTQEWRSKAQKADEFEAKNTEIVSFLQGIPEDLFEALKMVENGEDYRQAFDNKPKFDYNVPVEKQDIKTLVNTFFPGKFTDEDFTDEQPSEILQMAMDSSKDKFNAGKQVHDTKRVQITQKAEQALKAQNAAVQNSVSRLTQDFPDMEKENFTKVKSTIEGGPNEVLSLFYNKDGTAKPEAARLLTMAMYGEEEINRIMGIASHTAETKINEDIVSRGADTKKPVKTTGVMDKISEQEQEKIRELDRIAAKQKRTF